MKNTGNTSKRIINDVTNLIADKALRLLSCGQQAIDVLQSSYSVSGVMNADVRRINRSWEAAKSALDYRRKNGCDPSPSAAEIAITVLSDLEKVLDKRAAEVTNNYGITDQLAAASGVSLNARERALIERQIDELIGARDSIGQLSDTEGLRMQFWISTAGCQLRELWDAILDCDTDRLAIMSHCGLIDMFDCYPVIDLLEYLLAPVGIEFLPEGSESGCNTKRPEIKSSLIILTAQHTGLQLTYERTREGRQSTGASAVTGVITAEEGSPAFQCFAVNNNPEAVKAAAAAIAQQLRNHYCW